MNAETLKVVLVSGAVSAAVSFGVVHAASVAPGAQAPRAEAHATAPAQPAASTRRPARADATAESSSIREAHSDGGYQYWIEHQKAMP